MLGHNNPPPHEAMTIHIEDLFALVSATTAGATVETDEQDAALDSLLDDMRKARKDADAKRAEEKKPHDDAGKEVQARWKPLLDRCDMGADEIKRLLTPYRLAKQRAKDEAAAQARAEAQARLEAAQTALQQSDDLEARFAAESTLKVASKLTAAANRISRSATGLRTAWEAEVIDRRAALNFYIKRSPDRFEALVQQMADEDARATRGTVPGVVFHERKIAA
jgi:hypothetical protein